MRRIAFFTSTRAEYGLLRPIMAEVTSRVGLTLQVIASGTHLSEMHGETWREIESDGFPIDARVDMHLGADDANASALSAAAVLSGTAHALTRLRPDILVLLGDRYELLSAAQAAVLVGVPIAHVHGGEATEGAIDEMIRHAVTKLAYLHFPAAAPYADRICQMGESRDRVWNVGAPAMDNIASLSVVPQEELEALLGISLRRPSFLVTYHPATLESDSGLGAIRGLLDALNAVAGSIVFTGTNVDPGACLIRAEIDAFANANPGRIATVQSLGATRYLSLMHHVDAVVGNSSSGLLEAPVIGIPTVNIGSRQQGRLSAPSVIHCGESALDIRRALEKAISPSHRAIARRRETPYGQPGAACRIVDVLEAVDLSTRIKVFVDSCSSPDLGHTPSD